MTDMKRIIDELEETLQSDTSPLKTLEYLWVMARRKKVKISLNGLINLTKEHDPYLRYQRLLRKI